MRRRTAIRRIESLYKDRRIGRGRVVDPLQIRRAIGLVYGIGAPGAAPNAFANLCGPLVVVRRED